MLYFEMGNAVVQLVESLHYNQKGAIEIPDGVTGIFQ